MHSPDSLIAAFEGAIKSGKIARVKTPGYARKRFGDLKAAEGRTLKGAYTRLGVHDLARGLFPTLLNWIDQLDTTQANSGIISVSDGKGKFEWDTARILEGIEEERKDGTTTGPMWKGLGFGTDPGIIWNSMANTICIDVYCCI